MGIAQELAILVWPLVETFQSSERMEDLLRELGLVYTPVYGLAVPEALQALASTAQDTVDALLLLENDRATPAKKLGSAVVKTQTLFNTVSELQNAFKNDDGQLSGIFANEYTWLALAQALPGYLLSIWLRDEHPISYACLDFLGALEINEQGNLAINFGALTSFITDPTTHMGGRMSLDPAVLIAPLTTLLSAVGALRLDHRIRFDGQEAYFDQDIALQRPPRLNASVESPSPGANGSFTVSLEPVELDDLPGLELKAISTINLSSIKLSDTWSFEVEVDGDSPLGLILTSESLQPSSQSVVNSAKFDWFGVPEKAWALIGDVGSTRLELADLTIGISGQELLQDPQAEISLATSALRFVITASEGDSFVAKLLGFNESAVNVAVDASWSRKNGFRLQGGLGFDFTVYLDRKIGPVNFYSLRIFIGADKDGINVKLMANLGAILGPIAFSVNEIGMFAGLTEAEDGKGSLGNLDFALGFLPPQGFGISVDIEVIKGGGLLNVNSDGSGYAGALELDILSVAISAFGIINTKLPDGGWSLFFALFIKLPSIQLGFGFTLTGVGGVAGINRTIDTPGLEAAIRSGSLDSVLFPADPIADAPQIIAAVQEIFPSAEGRYVFGPVIQIGWGTPTLIEAEIGVIISLPDPIVIAIIGSIGSVLPDKEVELISLQLNVAGVIDRGTSTVSVDARLSVSHIAGFPLNGGMAFKSTFANTPTFLMALGGSHPLFDAPDDFPKIDRLSLAINAGKLIDIRFECYFAITSNCLQFGAAFELTAEVDGFRINGGTYFDALIIFSPFTLQTRIGYHVSISAVGVNLLAVWLEGQLTGPNPWYIIGSVTFKVLGLKTPINIDRKIGFGQKESLPPKEDVLQLLQNALAKTEAWSVGAGGGQGVVLAEESDSNSDDLAVLPDGTLGVSQQIMPLGITIDKSEPWQIKGGYNWFDLEVDATSIPSTGTLYDWFTVSSYTDLKPKERLSAPSFEWLKSGIEFGGGTVKAGKPRSGTLRYEVIIRDPELEDIPVKLGAHLRDPESLATTFNQSPFNQPANAYQVVAEAESIQVSRLGFTVMDEITGVDLKRKPEAVSWLEGHTSLVSRQADVAVVAAWEVAK